MGVSSDSEILAREKPQPSRVVEYLIDRPLRALSSVKLGILLLVLLIIACFIGMVVMQQNIDGFDKYYAKLTPAEQTVYGALGFFDIYHGWSFLFLLGLTSLNIILASIDRFPAAWNLIFKPKLTATKTYLETTTGYREFAWPRMQSAAEDIADVFRRFKMQVRITENHSGTTVFAESGKWNRMGAYLVHVGLLTIFAGGFLTGRYGISGNMALQPGQTSSTIQSAQFKLDRVSTQEGRLPFSVFCTDIQQKLIKKDGPLDAMNTIDWHTRIEILDQGKKLNGDVHLNSPFDYAGYRFFQASFTPFGQARTVTVRLVPESGGDPIEATISHNQEVALANGMKIKFASFQPDFRIINGQPDSASAEYNNPAAELSLTSPSGEPATAWAFTSQFSSALGPGVSKPVFGYKAVLADFEKVGFQHVLAVQYDPGRWPFYLGSIFLIASLLYTFFYAHQRMWAAIVPAEEGATIVMGGDSNRGAGALAGKMEQIFAVLKEKRRNL